MVSSGAYAFVTADWREKGYPLDLWLKHTTSLFDQTSLVLYGPAPMPERPMNYPGLTLKQISPPERKTYEFFTRGMQTAQDNLDTDWKVLLSVDEFLANTISFSKLNEELVYSLVCRNLYGNLNTEILVPYLAHRVGRVHTGSRAIINDGVVSGRRSMMVTPGQFWHTSFLRSPHQLSLQQSVRAPHEIAQGDSLQVNKRILAEVASRPFDYHSYSRIWPEALLATVKEEELPLILLQNRIRFDWDDFKQLGGKTTRFFFELLWAASYLSSTGSRVRKRDISVLRSQAIPKT